MLLAALVLVTAAALPLRAPARGPRLSTCKAKPWRGCPEEGGSRLGEKLAGFSEAMAMYDGSTSDKSGSTSARAGENGLDRAASKGLATSVAATTARRQLYKNHGADGSKSDESASTRARAGENGLDRAASKGLATSAAATTARRQLYKNHGADGSKSDKSGSTSARAGENGLDRAASKVFATSVAATMARLQLYKNHAANGGVDEEEEVAQGHLGRASWWLFQFLAILLELVLGLFVFGRVIPRRRSSAKGAAWRSYVVTYLLISPEIALVAAAATSVRGSDYTITKSSKIKTNESPSSSVQSLEQRRVLSGYVMTDSNIRTARDAWLADASAAETTYGHISTWDTSGVTDMSWLFCGSSSYSSYGCNTAAASFNEDISAWDTSGVTTLREMFYRA